YKYDPFGRRIEKSVNGTVTRYLYDREDIIARLNSNNQVVAAYSHGPETDEPLSTYQGGQWFFYHRDGLGSVTMMTDVSGTAAQSYNYGSFGNIIDVSNPNLIQPYTFTSREYDEETDLYYYRARYYDARAGRFISADPIGLEGGDSNYFRYVANNPVNWADPWGLDVLYFGAGASAFRSGRTPMDTFNAQVSFGVAFDTETKQISFFKSVGTYWNRDRCEGKVFGAGAGLSPIGGRLNGGMDDFFGTSLETTNYYGMATKTNILSESGAKGSSLSVGGKGMGFGQTVTKILTTPMFGR
ncbi:MAG: RHS repeat-associated core domain-containing protein, partial [Syntrophorhabdaceae bacterium]|nr:RHS repeat-associated core domain-containing protein [Syntrophorhabdaceae bacterium]